MNDYPREDKPLIVCLADNTQVRGMVNIAGRTAVGVIEDTGPDLVLYEARSGVGMPLTTVFIAKNQIVWIAPAEDRENLEGHGEMQKVRFKLANGEVITGKVDSSGFERLSDYFNACHQRFYEIHEASFTDRTYEVLYVRVQQVLWKEPID